MHYGATKITFQFAEKLRNNLTPAEKMLWYQLSKNALGHRFRCQHPIWRYVVDFYCHPVKLVIEVDGTIHTLEI
jgi:cyclase